MTSRCHAPNVFGSENMVFFIDIFISHIIPYSPFHLFPFLSFNFSIFQRFSTVLRHPAFLWHFAFNEVYSPFPHSHTSNALPSSPTTLSDNLSISQTPCQIAPIRRKPCLYSS